jgi:hypothetical protein
MQSFEKQENEFLIGAVTGRRSTRAGLAVKEPGYAVGGVTSVIQGGNF